jgi:hypothetical protein
LRFFRRLENAHALEGQVAQAVHVDLEDGADLAITQDTARYRAAFGAQWIQPAFKFEEQILLDPVASRMVTTEYGCLRNLTGHDCPPYSPPYFSVVYRDNLDGWL